MPAYQTTIMISAMTSRRRTVDLLKRAINHIIAEKGVVMGVQSLGTRALAYDIRHKKVLPAPPPPAPHCVAQPGAPPRASALRNYACERLTRAALAGDALNCQLRDHQVVLLPPGALPRPGLAPLVPYRATR